MSSCHRVPSPGTGSTSAVATGPRSTRCRCTSCNTSCAVSSPYFLGIATFGLYRSRISLLELGRRSRPGHVRDARDVPQLFDDAAGAKCAAHLSSLLPEMPAALRALALGISLDDRILPVRTPRAVAGVARPFGTHTLIYSVATIRIPNACDEGRGLLFRLGPWLSIAVALVEWVPVLTGIVDVRRSGVSCHMLPREVGSDQGTAAGSGSTTRCSANCGSGAAWTSRGSSTSEK